jgi:arylsulfatase A-like enzyme
MKILKILFLICVSIASPGQKNTKTTQPNIVLIFADDMGYGDMEAFGHPTIKTPNLNRMAYEGQKWTNFYVAESVCTPSRAGLMTGRLPVRSGMCSDSQKRVLYATSKGGLPTSEISIATTLKKGGYATGMVGKWHLGHLPQFAPNAHGFDYYYGIPYSNDMDHKFEGTGLNYFQASANPKIEYFNVPIMKNLEIIEQPAQQTTLTKRYTQEAQRFIENNTKKPFFLYLAHSMPHVPLFASDEFKGKSRRGIYGDVIEELDWSVGQILETLKKNKLDKNTLVVFTSDNGPWLIFDENGGSAGLLKGGKGGTYEGGMREPTLMWGPGLIKPGTKMDIATTLDLLPTFAKMANVQIPNDRIYDGYDISSVIFNKGVNPRDEVFYYRGTKVFAIRKGAYKAHFITQPEYGGKATVLEKPLLYNLDIDPSENYDIADKNPNVIKEINQMLAKHLETVVKVESQLEK